MTNKLFTATIVVLVLAAAGLGYLIYRQKSGGFSDVLFERRFSQDRDEPRETRNIFADTSQEEFIISVGENTKLFGIAAEHPYYGEPPASIGVGGGGTIQPLSSNKDFEIWGDVLSVEPDKKEIRISSDYPRPIATAFTPRGPEISLEDIKKGDRIVASGAYDESGEPDYNNIQFIQITPSEEEIKRLREKQNK